MTNFFTVSKKKPFTKPNIRLGGSIFKFRIFEALREIVLYILSLAIRLWLSTVKIEISPQIEARIKNTDKPTIILMWHNQLLMGNHWCKLRKRRKTVSLISAGAIGAWLSRLIRKFGPEAIRGSVNLRGKEALRELIKAVQNGSDAALTPDGSRGPKYRLKPGAVLIAQKTQSAILLVGYQFDNAWRLRTWDRFFIPKPFSKVTANAKYFSSINEVVNSEEISLICFRLEEELNKLIRRK